MENVIGFPHMQMIYPKPELFKGPTTAPDFGFFGHFRKLNINSPAYARLVNNFDNTIPNTMFVFEVQQELYKTRRINFTTSPDDAKPGFDPNRSTPMYHTVKAPPTGLELKIFLLLNLFSLINSTSSLISLWFDFLYTPLICDLILLTISSKGLPAMVL